MPVPRRGPWHSPRRWMSQPTANGATIMGNHPGTLRGPRRFASTGHLEGEHPSMSAAVPEQPQAPRSRAKKAVAAVADTDSNEATPVKAPAKKAVAKKAVAKKAPAKKAAAATPAVEAAPAAVIDPTTLPAGEGIDPVEVTTEEPTPEELAAEAEKEEMEIPLG